MRVYLWDGHGRMAGDVDVPDGVVEAAELVERYMAENHVATMCGLTRTQPPPPPPRQTDVPFRPEPDDPVPKGG